MKEGKIGVILLSMGGPDSLSAIQPFLYNLFSDPDIFRLPFQKLMAWVISRVREKKVRGYYEMIGGKSPQREQTEKQAKALSELLGSEYRVVVAMRYWHPLTEEALKELFKEKIKEIILLPMYPQFSKTTTGSSLREFFRVYRKSNFPKVPVRKIESYHNFLLYIKAMVENIKENLSNWEDYYFLFSAHSLPMYVIKEGDPYQIQTEETVKLIMKHFPKVPYSLGYQSKLGPVKWLQPTTEDLIRSLAHRRVRKLAVIPVSFVCEHLETLYELDVQYRKLAKELSVEDYVRIPTLKTHPTFIKALAELVKNFAKNPS